MNLCFVVFTSDTYIDSVFTPMVHHVNHVSSCLYFYILEELYPRVQPPLK